jgi:preprotein translocase subunit SecG
MAVCSPVGPIVAPGVEAAAATETATQQANEQKSFAKRVSEWAKNMKAEAEAKIERAKQSTINFAERHADKIAAAIKFARIVLMIAKWFPVLVLVLIALAFFGRPLEFIMLFLAAVMVSIMFGIMYIFSIDVIRVLPYLPYNIIVSFIPYLIFCVVILVVFLIISLFIMILALINAASGGGLKYWPLCHNSPEAWFKTPSYQLGNSYSRGFFCAKPCGSRYIPDGDNCKKIDEYQPSYCPNAEVMRMFTGYSRGDSVPFYADYNSSNFKYMLKQPPEREKLLKDHYLKRVKFLENCKIPKMMIFDKISLNMCASVDMLEQTKQIKSGDALKLKQVCKQAFCTAPSNYPFCAAKADSSSGNSAQLVKQLCKITAILIVFFLIFIMCLNLIFRK